jgi:hypothetical protein
MMDKSVHLTIFLHAMNQDIWHIRNYIEQDMGCVQSNLLLKSDMSIYGPQKFELLLLGVVHSWKQLSKYYIIPTTKPSSDHKLAAFMRNWIMLINHGR